jgi:hypothetical protein
VAQSESSSDYLLDIPAMWFIGLMMAGGAALGFHVDGFGAASTGTGLTAYLMAGMAVIAFAIPFFID